MSLAGHSNPRRYWTVTRESGRARARSDWWRASAPTEAVARGSLAHDRIPHRRSDGSRLCSVSCVSRPSSPRSRAGVVPLIAVEFRREKESDRSRTLSRGYVALKFDERAPAVSCVESERETRDRRQLCAPSYQRKRARLTRGWCLCAVREGEKHTRANRGVEK